MPWLGEKRDADVTEQQFRCALRDGRRAMKAVRVEPSHELVLLCKMKVTIASTSSVTRIEVEGHKVPARLWKGKTEGGVPVHCYVTLISPQTQDADALATFERELHEQQVEKELVSFDLRML